LKNIKVIFVNSIDFDSNADDLPLGLMILDKICRERVLLKLCGMREKRVEKGTKMAHPKPNQ